MSKVWNRTVWRQKVFGWPNSWFKVQYAIGSTRAVRRHIVDFHATTYQTVTSEYERVAAAGMQVSLVLWPFSPEVPTDIPTMVAMDVGRDYLFIDNIAGEVFQPLDNPAIKAIRWPSRGPCHGDVEGQRRPQGAEVFEVWFWWGWVDDGNPFFPFSDITHTVASFQVSVLMERYD